MTTTGKPAVDYDELIQDGGQAGFRVHRLLYYDPAIFQEEMENIFYKGWSYIGHESEVPHPGDYRLKRIGLQPVIMSRDDKGKVHVLLNRCAHRGNLVCRHEQGNAKVFTCIYHGWTYSNDGKLLGVPYPSGYDERFRKEDFSLASVPRMGEYRGFIFASLTQEGPGLEEYLGTARDYIDHFVDLSPSGQIELSAGVQKVRVKANWKLQLENVVDQYHVTMVHQSALPGRDPDDLIFMRDLGGGHAILDWWEQNRRANRVFYSGQAANQAPPSTEAELRHRRAIQERLGLERAEHIFNSGPSHITIFPNLFLLFEQVRVVQPVSVDECFIYFYPVLLKGAPPEINIGRVQRHNFGYGPAGFISPDDCEVFERTQQALVAREPEWLTFSRGLNRESFEVNDFGQRVLTSAGSDETAQRAIWRHYKSLMRQP
ncbi:MAG TPA: aromatic ring-hydroxylating dioxygenase subunit alpha [Dehalococcoidia bacterium]|nr:aromatic ring-hydroxylating dioxygenase subunit alpha [Dehalococcoidia bacterium]